MALFSCWLAVIQFFCKLSCTYANSLTWQRIGITNQKRNNYSGIGWLSMCGKGEGNRWVVNLWEVGQGALLFLLEFEKQKRSSYGNLGHSPIFLLQKKSYQLFLELAHPLPQMLKIKKIPTCFTLLFEISRQAPV